MKTRKRKRGASHDKTDYLLHAYRRVLGEERKRSRPALQERLRSLAAPFDTSEPGRGGTYRRRLPAVLRSALPPVRGK